MRSKLWALVAVPVFVVTFAATYFTLSSTPGGRVRGALRVVQDDPGNTVCLGGPPCIAAGAEYDLFVFFSRLDCAIGLYQAAVLDRLFREIPRERLNVIGVAYDLDRAGAERLAHASGIGYPVYVAPERMERRFGKVRPEGTNKPVALLLDRTGRVVRAAHAGGTVAEHEAFAREIAARVGGRAP